jgi:putative colanic acid biosynthesis glycosyltransferase WcaI
MRVLVVNQYYPPDAAASAYILGELTEDLGKEHEVCVVAGRPSYNPEAATYRPRGVRVIRTPSTGFSRTGIVGRVLNYLTFTVTAAVRSCMVARPDVVVTMTDPPVIGLIGVLAAARHRRPFVQICHDVYPDIAVALGKVRNPLAIRAWRSLNHMVRRRARRLVVVGRDMQEKLSEDGVDPAKLTFIPTWANPQRVEQKEVDRLRNVNGWRDRFVVMHAGNMGLAQNLGMFVDIAERLSDEQEILIVFLGDGAARPALEREAANRKLRNLLFLPYRPKHEAQALMAAADLHVVSLVPGLWGSAAPSKTYGIMAAGRPFIAAVDRGSEPARIAEEFACGITVDPGDPAALASAILKMREEPLDEMGDRARRGFLSRYERTRVTDATRELLEDVVASSGASRRSMHAPQPKRRVATRSPDCSG